jgi:hypothetical protein
MGEARRGIAGMKCRERDVALPVIGGKGEGIYTVGQSKLNRIILF